MANKAVVTTRTRVQIQQALQQLAQEKGSLRLAVLVPTELPERWSLLVSAPWMDSLGTRSVISDLTSRLLRHVDKNSLSAIDRVSVLPGSDTFVRGIVDVVNGFLGVDASSHKGGFRLYNTVVEGHSIPEAFVFVADPRVNDRPVKSALAGQKVAAR
jgi:hypothetical protein